MEDDARRGEAQVPSADDAHEQEYLRHFVEQYLTSRGFRVCSRNARVIVGAIANCRPAALDWAALEQCVERTVNAELLRSAA